MWHEKCYNGVEMDRTEYELLQRERNELVGMEGKRGGLTKMAMGRLMEIRRKLKDAHRQRNYNEQDKRTEQGIS